MYVPSILGYSVFQDQALLYKGQPLGWPSSLRYIRIYLVFYKTGCGSTGHPLKCTYDKNLLPAGPINRSPSISVLDIRITVSFIHQTSDYIKMSTSACTLQRHIPYNNQCIFDTIIKSTSLSPSKWSIRAARLCFWNDAMPILVTLVRPSPSGGWLKWPLERF